MIEEILARPLPGEGTAQESGQGAQGHQMVDLAAGDREPAELNAVVTALRSRFGPSKTVALDGLMDPSLRRLPGPPLADVLAGRAIEMYGWSVGQRWLGVGLFKGVGDAAPRLTAVVSAVAAPTPAGQEGPAALSWVEELAALTGWRGPRRLVDWESVERKLRLRLPRDYRLLAETFGAGTFDDNLELCAPGSKYLDLDLITTDPTEFAGPAPSSSPAIGLLQWAVTSAEHSFCWLVEDPDPDKWPVFARSDKWDPWERFDCSSAELVHRMLTDPQHPYSLARHFDTHWFTSAEQAAEAFWDDFHPHS
ncbi:SMI1/KNR4 family protein [Kitasatospora sp. NPDC059327]|uniref:SMI1/KNR4 family protein n=1 Tax=Kitasatospora sp. NPDC059327 TaxID=3346803 RepID=UPI0036867477